MYNTQQYNTGVYNTNSAIGASSGGASGSNLKFGDFVFGGDDIVVNQLDIGNGPGVDFQSFALSREDGQNLLSNYKRRKRISFSGIMTADTSDELSQKINDLKKELYKTNAYLQFEDGDKILRMQANCINTESAIDRSEHYMLTFCKFSVTFESNGAPYAEKLTYGYSARFAETSTLLQLQLNVTGNIANHQPTLIMIFGATSGVEKISFENVDLGEKISVNFDSTPPNGSVFIINGETKECTLDGAVLDYDGFFPDLQSGLNSVKINLTGTSPTATYDETLKWRDKFY